MTVRLPKDEDKHISGTDDIARIMQKVLWRQNKIHRQKEYFWTVGLNAANDIEYIELVTIGTSNRNIVTPVQVLSLAAAKQLALLTGAVNAYMRPAHIIIAVLLKNRYGGQNGLILW